MSRRPRNAIIWYSLQTLKYNSKRIPAQINSNESKIEPSNDEIAKLKDNLIEKYFDVFSTDVHLKEMEGGPMKIHLVDEVTSYAIHKSRPIPYAWRQEVKETLDNIVSNGVIKPLEDEPSDWCHPMVIVPKSKGGLRICIDLKKLNDQVKRPIHPLTCPRKAVSQITP